MDQTTQVCSVNLLHAGTTRTQPRHIFLLVIPHIYAQRVLIRKIRPLVSLFCGSGSTSNNLNQLSRNDSLSGTVEENLESVDHITSVLRCIVHGIATSGVLASVAFGKGLCCFHVPLEVMLMKRLG